MPSSKVSSWPRDRTPISCIFCTAGRVFISWAIREGHSNWLNTSPFSGCLPSLVSLPHPHTNVPCMFHQVESLSQSLFLSKPKLRSSYIQTSAELCWIYLQNICRIWFFLSLLTVAYRLVQNIHAVITIFLYSPLFILPLNMIMFALRHPDGFSLLSWERGVELVSPVSWSLPDSPAVCVSRGTCLLTCSPAPTTLALLQLMDTTGPLHMLTLQSGMVSHLPLPIVNSYRLFRSQLLREAPLCPLPLVLCSLGTIYLSYKSYHSHNIISLCLSLWLVLLSSSRLWAQ